tara:strand:- start:2245 stop:2361 length:117 start_codon:yes stop_codon:yes gene_type:complete
MNKDDVFIITAKTYFYQIDDVGIDYESDLELFEKQKNN